MTRSQTQIHSFGFRASRSTSQPLFALHRLLEMATQTDTALYLMFLDWEKAFDIISHESLHSALVSMGVPPKYVNVIDAIYSDPRLTLRIDNEESKSHSATAGIRQGCPTVTIPIYFRAQRDHDGRGRSCGERARGETVGSQRN